MEFEYFMREFEKTENQTKNLLEVVSYYGFSIFTTVKHREIPCGANVTKINF